MKIRFRASLPLLLAAILTLTSVRPAFAITVTEEKELGAKFIEEVRRQMNIIEDPVVSAYIDGLGARLTADIPDKPFVFHFYVADQDVFNAFAGPGGHIVVYRGTIAALDREDELAGIMAHEIAHVMCRHISKNIAREKKIQLASLAGMLAGIFLGAPAPAVVGGMATSETLSLAYSREDERQADEIGRGFLAQAGYGGAGYLSALGKMRASELFGPQQVPTYLTTHPGVEERMAAMDTWLSAHPDMAKDKRAVDPAAFDEFRARLIGLYGDVNEGLARLSDDLRKKPSDPALLYGQALAYSRLSRRREAVETMKKAVAARPFDANFLAGLGQVLVEAGQPSDAKAVLSSAAPSAPDNAEIPFWLGRAELDLGAPGDAAPQLRAALRLFPGYSSAFYFLGQALGQLGNMPEAHYNLGMYAISTGDWRIARFHLEQALRLAGSDPDLTERVEQALTKLPPPSRMPEGLGRPR